RALPLGWRRHGHACDLVGVVVAVGGDAITRVGCRVLAAMRVVSVGCLANPNAACRIARDRTEPAKLIGAHRCGVIGPRLSNRARPSVPLSCDPGLYTRCERRPGVGCVLVNSAPCL